MLAHTMKPWNVLPMRRLTWRRRGRRSSAAGSWRGSSSSGGHARCARWDESQLTCRTAASALCYVCKSTPGAGCAAVFFSQRSLADWLAPAPGPALQASASSSCSGRSSQAQQQQVNFQQLLTGLAAVAFVVLTTHHIYADPAYRYRGT